MARDRNRLVFAAVGVVLVLAAVGLGGLIHLRGNDPFRIDSGWNTLVGGWNDAPWLITFAEVMNHLGGGWVGTLAVPLGIALALILLRRPWSAAFFLVAEAMSALAVQAVKGMLGRPRPEEILVVSDFGSFPSGHTANAVTIAVAAAVLFPRTWVAVAGALWAVLMAASRTILHAHWISDTLGGAFLGAGAALVVAAIFLPRLRRERHRVKPWERRDRAA